MKPRKTVYCYKKDERKAYTLLVVLIILLMFMPSKMGSSWNQFSQVNRQQLVSIIKQNHGNPKLVQAVITVESRWDTKAVSSRGAVGLMQVMPSSAKQYGFTREDLLCPAKNIEAGCLILKDYQRKSKTLMAALIKYSGGAKNYHRRVMDAMKDIKKDKENELQRETEGL